MQQYFERVDWQGLKLPSAERRQRDSLKSLERAVWKDWLRLKKELASLGEELPPAELLPAKRKKQSPDPTKRDTSKEEFGRRALAGGNMWDLLSCLLTLLIFFDKNNPEMGIDSVSKQMHQKMAQHYWVNIVKQQVCVLLCFIKPILGFVLLNRYWGIVMYGPGASSWASQGRRTHDPRSPTSQARPIPPVTGGGCPTLIDMLIQPMETAWIKHDSNTGAGTVRQSDQRAYNATKRRSEEYHQQRPSSGA